MEKQICIRIPSHELKILDHYAKKTMRTQSDIIREFIRSLKEFETISKDGK